MSDQLNTPTPRAQIDGDEQADLPEGSSTPEQQIDFQGSRESRGVREARDRYRGERDAARDELAAAQARIEAMQAREVERLANELAQPSDLIALGGVTLADLLDADGDVDPEAVAEAVASLIESRPGLARNPKQRAVDLSQGLGGGTGKRAPTFADLFK